MVRKTGVDDEYDVRSSVLLVRNRWDDGDFELVSAERQDILRDKPEGFKIARRLVLLDLTRVGTPNFAIYL
jgi:hypothetical protein